MTYKALAIKTGQGESRVQIFVQYEIGYRVPKKDMVDQIAKALDVNPHTLYDTTGNDATEIMEMLFWLDDAQPSLIHLHQLQEFPGEKKLNPTIQKSTTTTMIHGRRIPLQPSGSNMACLISF